MALFSVNTGTTQYLDGVTGGTMTITDPGPDDGNSEILADLYFYDSGTNNYSTASFTATGYTKWNCQYFSGTGGWGHMQLRKTHPTVQSDLAVTCPSGVTHAVLTMYVAYGGFISAGSTSFGNINTFGNGTSSLVITASTLNDYGSQYIFEKLSVGAVQSGNTGNNLSLSLGTPSWGTSVALRTTTGTKYFTSINSTFMWGTGFVEADQSGNGGNGFNVDVTATFPASMSSSSALFTTHQEYTATSLTQAPALSGIYIRAKRVKEWQVPYAIHTKMGAAR